MCGETEAHKEERIAEIRAALSGATELSDADKKALIGLNFTEFPRVITAHRGHRSSGKLESLTVSRDQFEMACGEIQRILNEFHCFSGTDAFLRRSGKAAFDLIIARMRKELFTFSDLAHSVQDHARRVQKVWKSPDYNAKLAEYLGRDGLHNFVIALRNTLHHSNVFDADWELRWGEAGEKTAHFGLQKEELLNDRDDWGNAKTWLNAAPEKIDMRTLVTSYQARHAAFYAWFLGWCAANMPEEVVEYRGLKVDQRRHILRMEWNFMLREILRRRVDPIPHLEKFLTEGELAEASKLPPSSKAFADFVIACVDETSACSTDLRAMVYRLFDVPGGTWESPKPAGDR